MDVEQRGRRNVHRRTVGAVEQRRCRRQIQPRCRERNWRRWWCRRRERPRCRYRRTARNFHHPSRPRVGDRMPTRANHHRRQSRLRAWRRRGGGRPVGGGREAASGSKHRRCKRLGQCHAGGEHGHADDKPHRMYELRHVLSLARSPRGHLDAGAAPKGHAKESMQRHRRHGRPPPAGFTFNRRGIAVRAGTTGEVFLVGCFPVACFLSPARQPGLLIRLAASCACQADSCGVDRVAGWLRRAAAEPSCSHSTSGAAM
jgi:hypothetical protein